MLMLAGLVALPSFGIDMSLPALGPMGASLMVSPGRAGLTMSCFMVGFGVGPLFCGPVSDRVGRKPVALLALLLFTAASLGGAVSGSLPMLLAWRVAQGMGAGVALISAFAIIRDLFEGNVGHAKLSYVASLMLVVPMIAPAAGTLLLDLAGWRSIYGALAFVGLGLIGLIQAGFGESVRITGARLPTVTGLLRDYAHVLSNPTCVGYIFANAAAFGALFAYVSGSSLFFLGAIGLSRVGYSLVFAATSLGIMAGTLATARLTARSVRSGYLLTAGALIALAAGNALLAAILSGWSWAPGLVAILVLANLGFGLVAPNATNAALQPLPEHAGAVSALAASAQVLVGSISSAWVVSYPASRPGLSMAIAMAFWSAMACLALLRPACANVTAARRRRIAGGHRSAL